MGFETRCAELIEGAGRMGESERLHAFFEAAWQYTMEEHPEAATSVGHTGQNHRWTDWSLDAVGRRKQMFSRQKEVLETIEVGGLDERDRLNYDLFRRGLELAIEGTRFNDEYLLLGPMGGPHSQPAQILAMAPKNSASDFEDILSRLRGLPRYLEQSTALLEEGVRSEITQPRAILRSIPDQIEAQIVQETPDSPLLAPFSHLPDGMSEKEGSRVSAEAVSIFEAEVLPALRKFHEFVSETYIPSSRDSIARKDLPGGEEWYAHLVRRYTTTELDPKEIHQIGLSEVERIRREMDGVISSTGFEGSFEEFSEFLREDPQFYFERPEDLLTSYRDICKRADPELAGLFGKLPRLTYGVLPVPSYIEKTTTTAYYQRGSPQVGRPGYFYANTYDLRSRPRWEMEALTLHEAVPGHHLQIALAQELEGLPEFRKHAPYTAFVEGWGLYAESLGELMGFYQDPYSKFGQLTYEIWRAIRLVVDTGMHALGWSRERAIDFFKENASKVEHDIVVEIDRYISWPGQALAYKIGELKLKELRAYAKDALGDALDIRSFHDVVLAEGALPLETLDRRLRAWVEEAQAAT